MILLKQLFDDLKKIHPIKEMGIHAIGDGRLHPVYKNNDTDFNIEKWKAFHRNNPVYIKDDSFLTAIVNEKKTMAIHDTNTMEEKPQPFIKLDIQSVYIFPLLMGNQDIVGFVEIASLGEKLLLSDSEISMIETLIENQRADLTQVCLESR